MAQTMNRTARKGEAALEWQADSLEKLEEHLRQAVGLLWARARKGGWTGPAQARGVLDAHKAAEKALDLAMVNLGQLTLDDL